MKIQIDVRKFEAKPNGNRTIGGIKKRLAEPQAIRDLSIEQIAGAVTRGCTIEPGVCPLSEKRRAEGRTGTGKEDFTEQTVFFVDIDNADPNLAPMTPARAAAILAEHKLKPAFMYETFSSTAEHLKFRIVLTAGETITDAAQARAIRGGLIYALPQSDPECINADRIYFGTDKGLIEGFTDFTAVCALGNLAALAEWAAPNVPPDPGDVLDADGDHFNIEAALKRYGDGGDVGMIIHVGSRHGTLLSYACAKLTRYGVGEKAYKLFLKRVNDCEKPAGARNITDEEIGRMWRDACKHYETQIATRANYLPPEEYERERSAQIISLEPSDYTDVGQAWMFSKVYGDRVRFNTQYDFLVYDGIAWRDTPTLAHGLAQELTSRQLAEARERISAAEEALNAAQDAYSAAVRATQDDPAADNAERGAKEAVGAAQEALNHAEAYHKFVNGRRQSTRIKATLTEAQPALYIDPLELDANEYQLNTPAGTVDLRTGEMHAHDPRDYCTKVTGASPSEENADLYLQFIDRITGGDADLVRYLQEVAGMCAFGRVKVETLLIAYGEGGNGKSTLFNLWADVLGDYAGMIDSDLLTTSYRGNKQFEIIDLFGKRLVIAAETEEGERLSIGTLKHLFSTGEIKGAKKFRDAFKFRPSHTMVLHTNHLPKVGSNDLGTWDRLTIVPFKCRIRGTDGEIKDYESFLFDRCAGAVLAWIIEGAKRFIANNFMITPPDCVRDAIREYQADNDWLTAFLDECCDVGGFKQKSGELYDAYRTYCERIGEYTRRASDFKKALEARGFEYRKLKYGTIVHGLQLKDRSNSEPIDF